MALTATVPACDLVIFGTSGDSAGMIVMYIMIASSYILLSMAVKKVALGVAYALWEGIGILIITTFSVMWFHESLSPLKLGGLALLIAGITLIKYGTKKVQKKQPAAKPVRAPLNEMLKGA